MTSSSIPTTFLSTKPMFGKYCADSMLPDFSPMQTNASSMPLPMNTLDICCLQKASPWPHTKSKSSKTGQNPGKSRTSNPSLVLPTFTIISFTDILKSLFHLCVLPTRVPPGTFLMSAILPSKHLRGLHHSSIPYPLDPGHSNYSQDWHLWLHTHCCLFNHNGELHSTPRLFLFQNSTTMSTTKSYLQFLKLSSHGNITLKALDFCYVP